MDVSQIKEVQELEKLLVPLKKRAWIPVFEEAEAECEGSKFGGFPWMVKKQKWPKISNLDTRFYLQLKISELPDGCNFFSDCKDGYIMLFREEDEWHGIGKDTKAFLNNITDTEGEIFNPEKKSKTAVFTEEDSARLKQLNAEKKFNTPEARKLLKKLQSSYKAERQKSKLTNSLKIKEWKEIEDYPHPCELHPKSVLKFSVDIYDEIEKIAEQHDIYVDDIEEYLDKKYPCHAGDKLGGYPYWTQDEETPKIKKEKMTYFFQLDGMNGKSLLEIDGTGHLFYLDSDPETIKFVWACT